MFVTVLPNCLAPLIVQAALGLLRLRSSRPPALGFLGMGAQPPTPEWGTMLADGREFIRARSVGGHLPGPRHPDHRACDQPHGRRIARRARPQAQAGLRTMPLLEIQQSHCDLRHLDGAVQGGRRQSTSPSTPARSWPSSASPARANRWRCWPSWASCPGPPRSPPTAWTLTASDLLRSDARRAAPDRRQATWR